ncbi:MAG: holo-ACP synthase, partial [Gallionella sp.]
MIFGIGTDLVELARFEKLFARHGERLAGRMLSEDELPEFRGHADPARFIAKRFAAKEAFAKAVGSGLRAPVSLRRIGVTHDRLGKPGLKFDDVLHAHLAKLGITAHHLSVSDERNMIVAFV